MLHLAVDSASSTLSRSHHDPSHNYLATIPKEPLPPPPVLLNLLDPDSNLEFPPTPTSTPSIQPTSSNPFLNDDPDAHQYVDQPSLKTISFSQHTELFPYSPSRAPSSRICPNNEPFQVDIKSEQDIDFEIPELSDTNKTILTSIRRAADRSNRPPAILASDPVDTTKTPAVDPSLPGHATPNISSNTLGKPLERNMQRLQQSLLDNQKRIGKSNPFTVPDAPYLPDNIADLFPTKITIPKLPKPSHPLSLKTILDIFHSQTPTPQASPFMHERSVEAAETNSQLIARFNYDLQCTFEAFPNTIISPGSEFRPPNVLQPLLQGHPFWPKIAHDLEFGATYKFKPSKLPDSARIAENEALIAYGNHSSAKKRPEALISQKDTSHGWAFPVTFECARKIKGGRFGPLGVAQHAGITEKGEITLKDRLAHDQTFSTGAAPSLNKAVDDSDDIELVYGWCIERLLHQIIALRREFPTDRIMVCKFDWGAAYRRINGDGLLAANALTSDVTGDFANILSRLSFGGKPHPAMFSLFSEAACDLCNDLTEVEDWNHEICSSPLQRLMGPPKRLPDDTPFAEAKPLIVDVPAQPKGSVDVYLDDMIQLFLDRQDIIDRASAVVPLVLHLFVRPNHPTDEPIKHTDILAEDKMMAEGSPSEVMRVLGWELDTRRLLLILPKKKYLNWTKSVRRLADPATRKTTFQELESTLGKLIHSSKGIPASRFFLQWTRHYIESLIVAHDAKQRTRNTEDSDTDTSVTSVESTTFLDPRRDTRQRPRPWFRYIIPGYVKEDMNTWVELLQHVHDGVNLNLLTCRTPTNVLLADACPMGMGGYSLKSGRAWQIELDPTIYELAGKAGDMEIDPSLAPKTNLKLSNNLFEFIAQAVTIWLESLYGDIEDLGSILCMLDNSSAIGWMHRSSFAVNQPLHRRVTETLVRLSLQDNFAIHTEHVPGKRNVVADYLSRTFTHQNLDDLTHSVHELFPSQIPRSFRVYQLPPEIVSWISSVAPRRQECSLERSSPATSHPIEPGADGSSTYNSSTSNATPFWTRLKTPKESLQSSLHSSNASETETFAKDGTRVTDLFVQRLSRKPLASWRRLSGVTTGQAPPTSKVATPTTLLSHPLRRDGKTWTHRRSGKRRSHRDTSDTFGVQRAPHYRTPPTPPRRRRRSTTTEVHQPAHQRTTPHDTSPIRSVLATPASWEEDTSSPVEVARTRRSSSEEKPNSSP